MRLLIFSVLSMMVAGCQSAKLVEHQYAPQKGGTVRYAERQNGNLKGEIKARNIMSKFCGSLGYRVRDQNVAANDGNYVFIHFDCVAGQERAVSSDGGSNLVHAIGAGLQGAGTGLSNANKAQPGIRSTNCTTSGSNSLYTTNCN